MIKTHYDAVIFDLDGTLIDSMWVWDKIDEEFLSELGITVPNDMAKELEGKSFTETATYFKERFKLEMSVEDIKARWNEMAWEFYTQKVPLKKGVRTFLDHLSAEGIKLGIATSNSIELVEAVLTALNVKDYFTQVRTSCEVGRGKPYPDIYLKVAEDLQVEPSRCLIFEDIPNGIRAGKAAGMTAWAIEDGQTDEMKAEIISLADHYVQDYDEVIKILAEVE